MRASNSIEVIQLLKPQSLSSGAEAFTASFDKRYFRYAEIVLLTGTATGTIAAANIEESSDDSTFTDVSGTAYTVITSSNDDAAYTIRVDLTKLKRYVRVAYDVDTNAVLAAVMAVLADPVNPPATASTVTGGATIVAQV